MKRSYHNTFNSEYKYKNLQAAAKAGDVAEFQRMHEAGYQDKVDLERNVMFYASLCGHLPMLQYVHEHGFEWIRCVTTNIAYKGNVECLKYALENGAEFNSRTLIVAYTEQHYDCFNFALSYLRQQFSKQYEGDFFWCTNYDEPYIVDRIDLDDSIWRYLVYNHESFVPNFAKLMKEKILQKIEVLKLQHNFGADLLLQNNINDYEHIFDNFLAPFL